MHSNKRLLCNLFANVHFFAYVYTNVDIITGERDSFVHEQTGGP